MTGDDHEQFFREVIEGYCRDISWYQKMLDSANASLRYWERKLAEYLSNRHDDGRDDNHVEHEV